MTSDVRYEKLQKMIDAGRANLDKALKDIMVENEKREDLLVRPSAIDFSVENGAVVPTILLPEKGTRERFNLTQHSLGQVYERAGIPQRFGESLIALDEAPLLEENFRRLAQKKMADGVLVRHIDDQIKGWLSPSYKRMDSGPVIESFVKNAVDRGFVPFRGRNTDFRYQIQFVVPEVVTVTPNEYTVFGLSLVTGDYGSQALEVNMLIVRLLCTNLHEGYDMFRRVHLGSRFAMGSEESIRLSKGTLELDTRTVASAIGDVTAQFGDHVKALEEKIRKAAETQVENPQPLYEMLRSKGLKKDIVDSVKAVYESDLGVEVLPQEKSRWRFVNSLSYVSQGRKKEDEKIDLERLAMNLMN